MRYAFGATLGILWGILGAPALALTPFTMNPMVSQLQPTGSGASQGFVLTNPSEESAAIEVTVAERTMHPDGTETLVDAEEYFLVYPAQVLLGPGERQTVRVQWLGDPAPPQELAFRLLATELPIDITPTAAPTAPDANAMQVSINTLLQRAGSLYITPAGAAPDLQVLSATHQLGSSGEDQLVLTLENQGTAHTLIPEPILELVASGQSRILQGEELPNIEGHNLLPGSRREFVVPWPEGIPVSTTVQATWQAL